MQKSESSSTLVDTLDFVTIIEKDKDHSTIEANKDNLNDEIINIETDDIPNSPSSTPTNKVKTRSRLSSAFRSLRGKKTEKDSNKEILSSGGEEQETVGAVQVKKKSKLSKKFSLGGIKKHKIVPKKHELVATSATQTQGTLERQVLNLSTSEISLVDLLSDCEETSIKHEDHTLKTSQFNEGSPVDFDKIRKIQITIQGKKVERISKSIKTSDLSASEILTDKTTPTISEEDYLTETIDNSNKGIKKKVRQKKSKAHSEVILVTEYPGDIPPQEQAPAKPERSLISNYPISPNSGAIRKITPQTNRTEVIQSELMSRESLNERGRRIPKSLAIESTSTTKGDFENFIPTEDSIIGSHQLGEITESGNNLKNPNLSGSIAEQVKKSDLTTNKEQDIISTKVIDTVQYNEIKGNSSSLESDNNSSTQILATDQIQIKSEILPITNFDKESQISDSKKKLITTSDLGTNSFELNLLESMPAFGDLTMENDEPPSIMTSTTEKREHLYKILVIGELGTGKTSFIKRYVHQFFSQNYRATIGVDFALKVLHWDQNTIVRLQLWDIAGQERFGNMTRVYYKEAVGAFIVFDVTRSGTFDCVAKWKEDLDSKVQLPDGSPIPCILLANKCDQDKQGIIATPEKMDEYVKENGFAGWYETSAKENINIDEAARALVNKILLNDKLISDADIADSEKFNLDGGYKSQTTAQTLKEKCSC